MAKLSQEIANEIRRIYVKGKPPTTRELAKKYGVNRSVITEIIKNESYVDSEQATSQRLKAQEQ